VGSSVERWWSDKLTALHRRIGGPLKAASAFIMKHRPWQMCDTEDQEALEGFVTEN
jgi:myo-inositol-1-phosphate synthase